MPSTSSMVVSIDFASSTVITPSLPTFSMASARMSPIKLSPLALMAPTWAISVRPLVGFACSVRLSTNLAAADCHDHRLKWLFLGAIGNVQPARGLLCLRNSLHQNPVEQGSDLHRRRSFVEISAPVRELCQVDGGGCPP